MAIFKKISETVKPAVTEYSMRNTPHMFHLKMTAATIGLWGLAVWLPTAIANGRANKRAWQMIAAKHRKLAAEAREKLKSSSLAT